MSFLVCLLVDGYCVFVCIFYMLSDFGVGAFVMVFNCGSSCGVGVPIIPSCGYFRLMNTYNVVCKSATSIYNYSIASTILVC